MAWLEDGTLFDSTLFGKPLVFMTGRHSVLRGVEQLVIGMSAGESKMERISPELAFGRYRPELLFQVNRNWLTRHAVFPAVGMRLAISKNKTTLLRVVVAKLDGARVTLDANHRLAGKTIVVQIDLLQIINRSRPHASRKLLGL
jgi:FKBP-type peptidyl-prolyl cis-trans isomerase 2